MAKPWVLQLAIFSALRRLFRRSPLFTIAMNRAKVEVFIKGKTKDKIRRVKYRCACCGKLFDRKQVDCDHRESVVPLEGLPLLNGLPDFNVYIARLFSPIENLQILDKECHRAKTKLENAERRKLKNEREPKAPTSNNKRRKQSTSKRDTTAVSRRTSRKVGRK